MTENGRKKIAADLCSYIDKEHESLHMEIYIPGVEKEAWQDALLSASFVYK